MMLRELISQEVLANPGIKSRKLATKVGCSESYVSVVLNGRRGNGRGHKRSYFGWAKKIRAAYLWGQDIGAVEISKEIHVPLDMVITFLYKEGLVK
jgi:hypothetical protein